MSLVAKLTLASSVIVSAGIVYYVHYKQNLDRTSLHEGVIRDIERQKRRRAENLYMLQQQIDLSKELKKNQLSVADDGNKA
ncbi:hypothetical protein DAPPUDRAFT_314619 [Daphnia pulex]|uniref:Protein PET117 homolog, mitochondrial n=1 Tax=Daphnia pulex TaxID=6669 RepID=E9G6X4_DAPPU|nr:hypothetical protein DAPPUDRAFT_314619 [Daphnia pulex]|eukprot:EFX84361.1 hypothetical protein DAPPUDRAFT_314619 [Daphnia pulex]